MDEDDSSMDYIDVGANEQYVENVPAQVVTDCLATPVVLRIIFQNLPTAQLLKLALVNKLWREQARCVIRDRGRLTKRMITSCDKLRTFATDLGRMAVAPFSGMAIGIESAWPHDKCPCVQPAPGELDPVYNSILDGVKWKYLSLHCNEHWYKRNQCQVFLLAKKILENFSSNLQEFTLKLPSETENFIRIFLQQNCSFSSLKTLKFQDNECTMSANYTNLIKTLVSRAPELQTVYTEGPVNLAGNLLQESSAVHVVSQLYSPSLAMKVPCGVVGALRFKRMGLIRIRQGFDVNKFNEITSIVLKNSCATLKFMEIHPMFLVPLKIYGECLMNVTSLAILLNPRTVDTMKPNVWKILTSFDYTQMLPKVESITVKCSSSYSASLTNVINGMLEPRNAILQEPAPGRAANIFGLNVEWSSSVALGDSAVRLLGQSFPDLRQLVIKGATEVAFCRIWDSWLSLKYLDISLEVSSGDSMPNFDSEFCGISPEKVAELRKLEDEELERVEIVPDMPSINYLNSLEILHLSYKGRNVWSCGTVQDPTFLFSKVARCIAFRERDPYLHVTLEVDDKRDLRHMKRRVSVCEHSHDHTDPFGY